MPIYEYRCQRCGAIFEALVFASSKPTCPECGTEEISRLMSAPSTPRSDGAPRCDADCGAPRSCCSGGCCRHAH